MTLRVGKLGAVTSRVDPRTLTYRTVQPALVTALRAPSPFFDSRPAVFRDHRWPMLGNDRYGCCTISSIVRIGMARAAAQGIQLAITDDDVIKAYLDMTGGKDIGAMPIDALNYMRQVGINGYHVLTYARVDAHDYVERRSALQTFGALYVAAGLPLRLDDDRDRRLELTPHTSRTPRDAPRSMGGHAYDVFGGQRNEEFVVMWTDDMIEEEAWTDLYREEAWVFTDSTTIDVELRETMQDQLIALGSR